MPMGARECNLKIQHNPVRLRLEVLDTSNFGVHHSSTVNCLWLCPSLLKCCDTGVICNQIYDIAKFTCDMFW